MSCLSDIQKAVSEGKLPEMSPEEIRNLVGEVERIKEFVGERDGILGDNFRKAVEDHIENQRFQRFAAAREAKESLLKLKGNIDFARQPLFEGKPDKAVLSRLLGGTIGYSQGGNRGASVVGHGRHALRVQGMYLKIKEAGLDKIAENGLIDRDTAQEMFLFGTDRAGETKNPHALEYGNILRGANDSILADKQAAGSSVRRAQGYITKATHDPEKIRALGFEKWRDRVLESIDYEKTFGMLGAERVNDELQNIFNHIVTGEIPSGVVEARGKNFGKEQALSRSLFFKDGYAWFDYNKDLGKANLLESVLLESRRAGAQTGLMEAFGTNPELGFSRWVSELRNQYKDNPDALKRLSENRRDLEGAFQRALGYSDMAGTSMVARGAQRFRLWETLAKTGSASLSTMSDLAFSISRIKSQTNNQNFLAEAGSQVSSFLGSIGDEKLRAEAGAKLGVMIDHAGAELFDKLGVGSTKPGFLTRMAHAFQKVNLMKYIDQAAAHVGATHHAEALAGHAGTPWSKLPERLRASLERYDFDAKSWDLISRAVDTLDGKKLLTPEKVQALPDSLVKEIMGNVDPNRARFKVTGDLLAALNETADISASRSSDRVKHSLLGASVDDGSWGTFQRLWAQFKGPMLMNLRQGADAFMSHPTNRPASFGEAIQGKGDFGGLISLILFGTMLGYSKNVLKEAAMGRTPPSPEDPRVILDAFLAGGVAGIYGDLLFSELHRNYGIGTLDMISGPTIGTAAEVLNLGRKAINGESSWSDVFRMTRNQIPGQNLFYAKGALDYLFANRVNEYLNPGYKSRLESRTAENPGLLDDRQSYFMFRPTGR